MLVLRMFQLGVGQPLVPQEASCPPPEVHLRQRLEHQRLAESSRTLWKWGPQPEAIMAGKKPSPLVSLNKAGYSTFISGLGGTSGGDRLTGH